MTITKRKEKTTKSSLAYTRMFGPSGFKSPISGLEQELDIYAPIDTLSMETAKRNKLYTALTVAKQNKDNVMVTKIEKELGIRDDSNESQNTEDMKALLEVLRVKLMDPNISNEEHDRTLKTLAALSLGKGGGNMAMMAMLQSSNKPPEPRKDDMADLTKTLITSLIENKTKEAGESDMDKFIKYQKFLNENTPDPMSIFKDAQETLKVMGVDVSGSKSMQELQMGLEKMKLEKEFAFKDKELDAKAENTKMMGGWIKELSTAVVEGIVDSIDDEDEDDEKETKEKRKKKTEEKNIPREIRVRCFNCKKQFKIDDPSETREIVCSHCSWPHYFRSETNQVQSITADNIRSSLKMEPKEWLDKYQSGQLEEMLNESKTDENEED